MNKTAIPLIRWKTSILMPVELQFLLSESREIRINKTKNEKKRRKERKKSKKQSWLLRWPWELRASNKRTVNVNSNILIQLNMYKLRRRINQNLGGRVVSDANWQPCTLGFDPSRDQNFLWIDNLGYHFAYRFELNLKLSLKFLKRGLSPLTCFFSPRRP